MRCDAISMAGLIGIVNTLLQKMINIVSFIFYYNSSIQCQMYLLFFCNIITKCLQVYTITTAKSMVMPYDDGVKLATFLVFVSSKDVIIDKISWSVIAWHTSQTSQKGVYMSDSQTKPTVPADETNPTPKPAPKRPKKQRPPPEKLIPHSKDMDATKHRVHPRFAKGKYQSIRLAVMYAILMGFLVAPWLRWNGRQAILLDVVEPKFYIFGATFMPQDFYFFAFVFIIAAMTLFMVTVYAGRVWCGYACPQTIYVHLYQHVEKWIIGERNQRIKFDKQPWGAQKIIKTLAVHTVWGVISAVTALTFIAFIVGTDYLFFNGSTPFFMGWGKMTWVFFLLITFVTQTNGGYMREHMCVHLCPYGRFQSVMFDKDTLLVSYDYERGEPRGARKKDTHPEGYGDCVDCSMCVQVCPTGIDIRDGLQVECIQCAACIDACNEIMDKVGYPRGLIRYTTERQMIKKEKPRSSAHVSSLTYLY